MKASHASLIAIVLSAACSQAQAIPIVFEFTGTVSGRNTQLLGGGVVIDNSMNGVAYSASLTIESDLLLPHPAYTESGFEMIQDFSEPEFGTPAVVGSLVLGGETIDLRPYSRNVGNVSFTDSLEPMVTTDGFSINANSRAPEPTFPAEGVRGSGRVLSFGAYDSFLDPSGMFSLDTLTLEDLISMPLPNTYLSYLDIYWTCETTYCIQVPSTITTFSIDTLTRRVGVASVPEPATLGLFALGLIGVASGTRRRSQVSSTGR